MACLAIDVGTCNTCACVTRDGVVEIVRDDGDLLIPSVIRYNNDGSIQCIGKNAYRNYWSAKNVVRCFKRIIGYHMNSKVMSEYMKNCACRSASGCASISRNAIRFRGYCNFGRQRLINGKSSTRNTPSCLLPYHDLMYY